MASPDRAAQQHFFCNSMCSGRAANAVGKAVRPACLMLCVTRWAANQFVTVGFHGWDAPTSGMTPTTRSCRSEPTYDETRKRGAQRKRSVGQRRGSVVSAFGALRKQMYGRVQPIATRLTLSRPRRFRFFALRYSIRSPRRRRTIKSSHSLRHDGLRIVT